jgi:hypothetical protein
MSGISETLDLVKAAQANPRQMDEITKTFTQAMSPGLIAYDLEAPAKKIVPVITPLRNMTPRVTSNAGDTATRWKAITRINSSNVIAGVVEGARGGVITDTVEDMTASYVGLGLENWVTFEADYAAQSFDDVKARAVENLLYSGILKEEDMLLGGNASLALGTTPTPSVSAGGSGATLGAATYVVYCVALSAEGYRRSTLSGGVVSQVSRTPADGGAAEDINAGAAQVSSASSGQAVTLGQSLTASVTPVKGAVAYAWYVGTAGNEKLEAITTTSKAVFSVALTAGTRQAVASAPSTDHSRQNGYSYDGFLYTALKTSGAYYRALTAGSTLTADGKGGVIEINDVLGWYWDNLQCQPDAMWVNREQVNDITNKCVGVATSPFRFNLDMGSQAQGNLVGGGKVTQYQSPVDSSIIPINVHPKMPPGTVMFTTRKLPYALNNVGDTFRIKNRKDWYQIEWPLRTRRYEYGVYLDSVFQHYFPVSMGVLTNITAG